MWRRKQLCSTALGAAPLCLSRGFQGNMSTNHISSMITSPLLSKICGRERQTGKESITAALPAQPQKVMMKFQPLWHQNGFPCPYLLSCFPHTCGSVHSWFLSQKGAFHPKLPWPPVFHPLLLTDHQSSHYLHSGNTSHLPQRDFFLVIFSAGPMKVCDTWFCGAGLLLPLSQFQGRGI